MQVILGDITKIKADAIVNAASTDLMPHPGICSAIYAAADNELLKMACKRIGYCKIGHAVATPSCGLEAKYIIHVAGAGWYGGKKRERILMAQCYFNALQKGRLIGCKSIAVPLIFSGDCHMPRAESISIAVQAIKKFEERHPEMQITLVFYRKGIYEMALRILEE